MAWNLSSTPVNVQEKIFSVGGFVAFSIFVMCYLPEDSRYLLMSATWPVMIYARGSQILATYQVKHTGNLSIVTTSMNLVGALIRVGTTIQETGDIVVMAGYVLSFILSFGMFVQYFLYLKNTQEFAAKSKKD
jgi:mannose-P-dolichol utilization defect protein 1